jgi:two-component system sensor histidine kinase YesM
VLRCAKVELTTIIVISFVTVFAIFITGISLMSYKIFFDFTSEEISATRLTLLNQSTDKVSSFNSSVSEAAIYIAVNRNVIETFSSEISSDYDAILEQRELTELLNGMVSLKREINSIELYTDRYNMSPKINESSVFSLEVLNQQSWFVLFDSMDHGWIPQHISPLSGQEIISYVHRLVNHRGQTVGYVKVNVRDDTFFKHMEDADFFNPAEDPLLLLNTGGRIIAQSSLPHHMEILKEIIIPISGEPFLRLNDHYDHLSNHHQVLKHDNELYLLLISRPNYDR